MAEKDPEAQVLVEQPIVTDAGAKEAAPKVQAFWLFIWMIK